MAKIFSKWNDGILSSYLIEITAKILERKDDLTDEGYVVDYVSLFSPIRFLKLTVLSRIYLFLYSIHYTISSGS